MDNYQAKALRTAPPPQPIIDRLGRHDNLIELIAVVGKLMALSRIADALKSTIFYGKEAGVRRTEYRDDDTMIAEAIGRLNPEIAGLLHCGLGQLTESAELLETIMNHLFHGQPLDVRNIVEELGDNQWFTAIGSNAVGMQLEQVQEANIAKLRARYPQKFDEGAALNRNLDEERSAMDWACTTSGGS